MQDLYECIVLSLRLRDCVKISCQVVLHMENHYGFGYFTGFLLAQE